MVRSNTGHERYIDLFLKNLPLTPSTAYRLSFDVLGAPLNLWFNDRHVETVEGDRCTPFCCKWTQHTVCFTTNAANRSSLPHYCFSFNKQLEGFPVTGRQDSYIDNVFLARQDEPEINLHPRRRF